MADRAFHRDGDAKTHTKFAFGLMNELRKANFNDMPQRETSERHCFLCILMNDQINYARRKWFANFQLEIYTTQRNHIGKRD